MSFRLIPLAFAVIFAVAACGGLSLGTVATMTATLRPVDGSGVSGDVTVYEVDGGVLIEGSFRGLSRRGHGFHIHEKGDCSGPGAEAAGGHWNPGGEAHGRWDGEEHHLGDLPILVGDATGQDTSSVFIEGPTFRKGRTGVAGRSLIVHANRDEPETQPDGGAGPAVACGVIGAP